MTEPLTLTAYAARRGCSVKSVSLAASSGRLVASVGRDERGRPVILDPDLADLEWTANTRQVQAFNVSRDLRAAAAARREAAQADLAELELAAKRGKLADVAELTGEFNAHITNAKARLLALPTHVGQELPDLAERVVPVVDRLIRAALQELAADGRGT